MKDGVLTNHAQTIYNKDKALLLIHINSNTRIDAALDQDRQQLSDRNKHVLGVGEARAIWDVGHYGKSLYLQNSESSNCICVLHYSSVICRLRRASNIYIL